MKRIHVGATVVAGIVGALVSAVPATAAVVPYDTLDLLAAGERTSVLTVTSGNSTTLNNGTQWYYRPEWSMGFVDEGGTVTLGEADVNDGPEAWSRLSWHLLNNGSVDYIADGYRIGSLLPLNEADSIADFKGRYIFTAETLPAYYPVGPQENVDVADLDGWTLCWSNLYSDDDSNTATLTDVWAACDGNYLMIAGGGYTEGTFDEFNNPAAPETPEAPLASTGVEAGSTIAFASVLVIAGAAVMVRRRKS